MYSCKSAKQSQANCEAKPSKLRSKAKQTNTIPYMKEPLKQAVKKLPESMSFPVKNLICYLRTVNSADCS